MGLKNMKSAGARVADAIFVRIADFSGSLSSVTGSSLQNVLEYIDQNIVSGSSIVHKVDATTGPTVNNDDTESYSVGSVWIDVTADEAYKCLDATTGAAVWVNTTFAELSEDPTPTIGGDLNMDGKQIDDLGRLGFNVQTVAISLGIAAATKSVAIIQAETGTADNFDGIAAGDWAEGDILYLYNDTGDTITLKHNQSIGADINFQTCNGGNIVMRDNIPNVFQMKGTSFVQVSPAIINNDEYFRISDNGDPTKLIRFQAVGLTTGQTRTITMPDKDLTLMGEISDDTTPQFGGEVDRNGNNIDYSAVPSDDSAVGEIISIYNLGATIAVGELVYLGSGSKWLKVDASAVGTAGTVLLGICLVAGDDTDATKVLLNGLYRDDSQFAFTVGAVVYASETAGDFTETAPSTTDSVVRVVGHAVSADVLYFNPSQDHITIV